MCPHTMCYDISIGLKKYIEYCRLRDENPDYIAALERKLEEKKITGHHVVSGFTHPKLLVFTCENPSEPQLFTWGLIPSWVKTPDDAKQLYNSTLNARGETIFEKPSFRNAAQNKRCLIYVDGFFESFHAAKKTYPFHILMKDDSPMIFAGLYDEWVNTETGEIVHTVTIVTTTGNETMSRIHNNPKADGSRMPVILSKEKQDEWLMPINSPEDRKKIEALIKPCDGELLRYYTVRPIKGKNSPGDVPEAEEEFEYPELALLF